MGLPVLNWLRSRAADRRKAKELYGAVVTQARQPMFYSGLRVPDTPAGRYEMIALHLFLLLERLRAEGAASLRLSRYVIEAFVVDMDDAMREMGVGDLTVPKRVKRAAAGFYERAGDYRAALADPQPSPLAAALARHIWTDRAAEEQSCALLLSAYARGVEGHLAGQDATTLMQGMATFPPVVYMDV